MFSKEINKVCAYCEHSRMLASGRAAVCDKKQELMKPDGRCASYKYDPLKREPSVRKKEK